MNSQTPGTPPTEATGTSPPPAPEPAVWQVRLLGEVVVRGPDGRPRRLPSRAAALLLARLALAPQRLHPREELVDLLWPGAPEEAGRNRLRQTLSILKSALETGAAESRRAIDADRAGLRVVPGALDCDAIRFERHLRSGDWAEAEALYLGELMPGHYDEWVLDERTRLAALAERLGAMPRLSTAAAPPARPPRPAMVPGQLPAYWSRLFGIEQTAPRLREMVRQHRLVTLLGAGGSGKTRLAAEVARALAEPVGWSPDDSADARFDVVAFVALVDVTDTPGAVDALAAALRVQGREPLKGVAAALAGQHALLVLDNVEQLAAVLGPLVLQLLSENAGLHLLLTSRLRLGLPDERLFELGGLPLPALPLAGPKAAEAELGVDALARQAAVGLFVDRARAAAPDFVADAPALASIAELVRRLAGMPLAIELAASRTRSLAPAELNRRLAEGATAMLDLLAPAGHSTMAQRHASMRGVLAWSWAQLSPPLAELMQALAVFAVPARAETIAAVAGLAEEQARHRLEQLRDHSLLIVHAAGGSATASGGARWVLLQPVREFAMERTEPERALQLRARLREWSIAFARRCSDRGLAALAEVEAELPLLYATILAAAADGPAARAQALRMAVALRRHWEVDTRAGLPLEVTRLLDEALEAEADDRVRCEAALLLAFSHVLDGNTANALQRAERALGMVATGAAPGPVQDVRLRAQALMRHSHVVMFSPSDQSSVDGPLAEAAALARQVGDAETEALVLRMQFLVAGNRDNDNARALRLAEQNQALWERAGHRRNAYGGLMDRASCWIRDGRIDEAATALAACEHAARRDGYATGFIMSAWQLGRASLLLRRPEEALAAFRRCLQGAWEHKRLAYVADALVQLPGGLAFSGQPENAARLMGFAIAHWQQRFGPFYAELEQDIRPTRRWLRGRLGSGRFETLRTDGACMTLPEAVALGLGPQPAP